MKKTPNMTKFKQGDVVLLKFNFSDGTGDKLRPAVIFSGESYNEKRQEVIVAVITSNTTRLLCGDIIIKNWKTAGLKFPSAINAIFQTVKTFLIDRKLGTLSRTDLKNFIFQLKEITEIE